MSACPWSVDPANGFTAEIEDSGRIRVDFDGSTSTRIEVRVEGSAIEVTISESTQPIATTVVSPTTDGTRPDRGDIPVDQIDIRRRLAHPATIVTAGAIGFALGIGGLAVAVRRRPWN